MSGTWTSFRVWILSQLAYAQSREVLRSACNPRRSSGFWDQNKRNSWWIWREDNYCSAELSYFEYLACRMTLGGALLCDIRVVVRFRPRSDCITGLHHSANFRNFRNFRNVVAWLGSGRSALVPSYSTPCSSTCWKVSQTLVGPYGCHLASSWNMLRGVILKQGAWCMIRDL